MALPTRPSQGQTFSVASTERRQEHVPAPEILPSRQPQPRRRPEAQPQPQPQVQVPPVVAGPPAPPAAVGPSPSPSRPASKSRAAAPPRQRAASAPPRRRKSGPSASDWARVAPVYKVDGPRVRLGVAWFVVGAAAVVASPITAAIAYAVVAGWAARQVVQAWHSPSVHADLAAGLAAVPVLAALGGVGPGLLALGAAAVVAVFAGIYAPGAGLRGSAGHLAGIGILLQASLPVAIAGGAVVLARNESIAVALLLFAFASAYEVGDFLVGSGSSNPIEGPLAGGAAVVLTGFPLAMLLVDPFDVLGVPLLAVAAVCCPVGQWIASAVLPRPEADAPALRRLDTMLLLAPMWIVAAAAL